MLRLADRVVGIHRAFADEAVPHAFGAAIAYAYHAEPRATRDIDVNVFVPSSDAPVALRILRDVGVTVNIERDSERAQRDAQVRLRWGPVPVDLFFSALDFHDECRRRARVVPFGAVEIPILSAEDLAVCKVAFNRDKDWVDLREMLLIQGERFDAAYALRWLSEILGPEDQRALRFQGLLRQTDV